MTYKALIATVVAVSGIGTLTAVFILDRVSTRVSQEDFNRFVDQDERRWTNQEEQWRRHEARMDMLLNKTEKPREIQLTADNTDLTNGNVIQFHVAPLGDRVEGRRMIPKSENQRYPAVSDFTPIRADRVDFK